MNKKARLGKGLDALLGGVDQIAAQSDGELRYLPVATIRPGRYQPRTNMDETALTELADSIRTHGVVQPIVVRETPAGDYELIAGERRWRAAQMAGLDVIPSVVRRVADEIALAVGLIENIQRENLNPVEEANGLRRLLDEFGLTHQQVADSIGRSRAAVSNLLRLLNLDPAVRAHLENGRLEAGHARAILSLPREQQLAAADTVIQQRLSVRQTEQLVRRYLSGKRKEKRKTAPKDADLRQLEEELSQQLAATVSLEQRGQGGRVIIEYNSLDELEGILERLRK
ncbi:MAG: ParB/RepB/Spo0J family partition protein [Arenicellales bacterium]|jgi:ParB family chromosome partitioning protein|nr:ParB/RepB/Spo0J family partition protein [Arenicellales bacterium]MEE3291891.1 ParB/RepB/Spo0J family partition protein [Pseudomonadota bacterium]MDP6411680.1 ParB/RepB/Spo0J family partition protein [Arenicellales bacterium]MDP6768951.1 ParB/RepB/Spo0J family partition protein [Arenicellales bacterium]MDP7065011.1 ParB/RepB/Spo0J family partition protein [Arenicellales bacterium]|tara:strand:+ start:5663 stop:6517 length:855 start_codon:yes stop_codon:yes gene_type:complete